MNEAPEPITPLSDHEFRWLAFHARVAHSLNSALIDLGAEELLHRLAQAPAAQAADARADLAAAAARFDWLAKICAQGAAILETGADPPTMN